MSNNVIYFLLILLAIVSVFASDVFSNGVFGGLFLLFLVGNILGLYNIKIRKIKKPWQKSLIYGLIPVSFFSIWGLLIVLFNNNAFDDVALAILLIPIAGFIIIDLIIAAMVAFVHLINQ